MSIRKRFKPIQRAYKLPYYKPSLLFSSAPYTFTNWYRNRYGLCYSIIDSLLSFIGVSHCSIVRLRNYFTSDFPTTQIQSLFSNVNLHLDASLPLTMFSHQRAIRTLNSRRGIRMFNGLSCNGQRTRSNCKTTKKFHYMYNINLTNPLFIKNFSANPNIVLYSNSSKTKSSKKKNTAKSISKSSISKKK